MQSELSQQKIKRNLAPNHIKKQIIQTYFVGSHHEFDQTFVDLLFSLADADQDVDALIAVHAETLLHSRQSVAKVFLEQMFRHKKYSEIARNFIRSVIELKITMRNRQFQQYILESLLQLLKELGPIEREFMNATLVYLSLKMKSFDIKMRVNAVKALKSIGEHIQQLGDKWGQTFRAIIPTMIEKQKLVLKVSYTTGLFLHVLEDEFCEVRRTCIQCLGLFRNYIKAQDFKMIIVYMLNDEHQIVREEALIASKYLKDQQLTKEDLETIMMCLQEKRTNMRRLIYDTLAIVQVSEQSLLLLIIEKVLITLQIYRSDKKPIFRMLLALGIRYWQWVGNLMQSLAVTDIVEPNWRYTIYRAKMVFCHEWWKRVGQTAELPTYFVKHMLYISDVQSYLFGQDNSSMQAECELIDINKLSKHNLIRFIQCEQEISQQFHRTVLEVLRYVLISHETQESLLAKTNHLAIFYNIKEEEIKIKQRLEHIIKKSYQKIPVEEIKELVHTCIQNREKYEEKNVAIAQNKCAVSRLEPNIVKSNKGKAFIERTVLKCWKNSLIDKDRKTEFKRLADLPQLRQDDNKSFWIVNLSRYSKIECVLLMADNTELILDTFEGESR